MSVSHANQHRGGAGRRAGGHWPLRLCLGLGGSLLVAAAWMGCSIEKHYAILSLFFDGVPDPTLVQAGQDAVAYAKQTGGVYYVHEPYAKQQCRECHRDPGGRMLAEVDSSPCLKCHGGVPDEHRYMHGPVVVGACLLCHAPHESTVQPMLRLAGPKLCVRCHDASLSGARSIPEHADPQRDCLDCHSGHGSPDRYFLHVRAPPPADRARGQTPPSETTPRGTRVKGEP